MKILFTLILLYGFTAIASKPVQDFENFGVDVVEKKLLQGIMLSPLTKGGFFGSIKEYFNPTPELNLNGYRGKWVFLHFWATWCGPCIAEMQQIKRLQKEIKLKDIVIIPITIETDDNLKTINRFKSKHNLKTMSLYINGVALKSLLTNYKGLPYTAIVNPYGKVVAEIRGARDWSSPEAMNLIDYLLGRR